VREFFPLPHVLKQIFSLVSQHYGLAFHLVEKPEQVFRNSYSAY
jgi:Zn-dependent oligopeptidase